LNSKVRATYIDGMIKWLLVPKLKPVRDGEFTVRLDGGEGGRVE